MLFRDLEAHHVAAAASLFREADGSPSNATQRAEIERQFRRAFDGYDLKLTAITILRSEAIPSAVRPGSGFTDARAVEVKLEGTSTSPCFRLGVEAATRSLDLVRVFNGDWYILRATAGPIIYLCGQ